MSSMLSGYNDWPHLAQVFKLEYWSDPISPLAPVALEPASPSPTKPKTKTKPTIGPSKTKATEETEGPLVIHEVRYGVCRLKANQAGPARLMQIARGEWGIENNTRRRVPNHRRDVTLDEDHSQLRQGNAPQANATVLGLLGLAGVENVAQARREIQYVTDKHLALLAR